VTTIHSNSTVFEALFAPVNQAIDQSAFKGYAPVLSDRNWLHLNLVRVIESAPSGRGFLQEHGLRFESTPIRSTYFLSLHSERRARFLRDVGERVIASPQLPSRLADLPELAQYRCFAADGHWHKPAVHDPKDQAPRPAVGHFYSLDLSTHLLRHLAVAVEPHEHDMSVLKRLQPPGLRYGVPRGTRVLNVYDRAGIDFAYWARCRQQSAVYFLSRVKEGMVFDYLREYEWNRSDPRNAGVSSDRAVMSREGYPMRVIHYTDPATGKEYQFLTNVTEVPPGVLAELYRRRWDIEKVFDEIKNKLDEKKAWATSQTAKEIQGRLVALAHNLMLLYRNQIQDQGGLGDEAEVRRREKRRDELKETAAEASRPVSSLAVALRGATQLSVKFVRWLRYSLRFGLVEDAALPHLATLMRSS
jgi:hypothetical protein